MKELVSGNLIIDRKHSKSNGITEEKNVSNKISNETVRTLLIILCQIITLIFCGIVGFIIQIDDKKCLILIIELISIDMILSSFIWNFKLKNKTNVDRDKVDIKKDFGYRDTNVLNDEFTPTIILVGIKTPINIEILIDKKEFIIGKNKELVDGVIRFNNAISRIHCKFKFINNRYYIEDMGSANGTYLNGDLLDKGQLVYVEVGDKIKLANSEFIIKDL